MPELNEPLSERELDILRLVATGAANKEIAQRLVISPNTVKVHLRNIFTKIGVASRTEATLYAVKIGLVRPHTSSGGTAELAEEPESKAEPGRAAAGQGLETSQPALPGQDAHERLRAGLQTGARTRLPAWQIVLLIVTALLFLLGGSVLGARLMARATPLPTTIAAGATAQPVMAQRWSTMAEMPSPRKGMGTVAYENALYLVAGETSQGIDGVLLRYEQGKNAWSTLASKKAPVTDIQAALVGEKIYVPGGRLADGSATDILEVYDPRKGTWENKAPLPEPLSAYGMVSFEGQLYLFGGKNGEQYSAGVYVYNPHEDRWSTRTKLQSPRAYAGVVESGGKIYVIGGYDGKHALDLNEAYLPNRDIDGESPWKTFAPLPESRYGMGIAQVAGLIYLLGGSGENGLSSAKPALQYNVQEDQWGEYETPPVNVGTHVSLLTAGNYLHVLGGETSAGLSATNLTYRAIYTVAVPILVNDGE